MKKLTRGQVPSHQSSPVDRSHENVAHLGEAPPIDDAVRQFEQITAGITEEILSAPGRKNILAESVEGRLESPKARRPRPG